MTAASSTVRAAIRNANVRAVLEDISFEEACIRNTIEAGRHRSLATALAVSCVLLGMTSALHYLR